MSDIKPYKIAIPDSALQDLQKRLSLTKFPNDELDSAGWDYGTPLNDVKKLITHWRDNYSWRKAEEELNQYPHFMTSIQCTGFEPLQIHFLHQKSSVANALPLLFIHGWPGSFHESLKILKPLSQPDQSAAAPPAPAFHVVVISLPNYAFSQGSRKKGFALAQYAETCNRLMLKLGYNEYVTQGGDWGYFISRTMSLLFPQNVKATHLNMDQGFSPTLLRNPYLTLKHSLTPYNEREKRGFARNDWFLTDGSGYRSLQSTKPQTLGYSFADSPSGLLAWIYEKLHDWTDDYPWTPDEICTWISIYWFSTAGPAANVRIYYEAIHSWTDQATTLTGTRVTRERTKEYIGGGVKLGLSHSPRDLSVLPSSWTRTQGQVVFEKFWDFGGHFFAWENPTGLVEDVRTMFGKGGGAEGCVRGKSGYDDDGGAVKAKL